MIGNRWSPPHHEEFALRRPTRSLAVLGSTVAVATSLTGALQWRRCRDGVRPPRRPVLHGQSPGRRLRAGQPGLGVACARPGQPGVHDDPLLHPRPDARFYGLGPLASSNDGAGQTIVLVDAYGSPTGAQDLELLRQDLRRPDARTSRPSSRSASRTTRTRAATATASPGPPRPTAGLARPTWTSSGPTRWRPRRTSC